MASNKEKVTGQVTKSINDLGLGGPANQDSEVVMLNPAELKQVQELLGQEGKPHPVTGIRSFYGGGEGDAGGGEGGADDGDSGTGGNGGAGADGTGGTDGSGSDDGADPSTGDDADVGLDDSDPSSNAQESNAPSGSGVSGARGGTDAGVADSGVNSKSNSRAQSKSTASNVGLSVGKAVMNAAVPGLGNAVAAAVEANTTVDNPSASNVADPTEAVGPNTGSPAGAAQAASSAVDGTGSGQGTGSSVGDVGGHQGESDGSDYWLSKKAAEEAETDANNDTSSSTDSTNSGAGSIGRTNEIGTGELQTGYSDAYTIALNNVLGQSTAPKAFIDSNGGLTYRNADQFQNTYKKEGRTVQFAAGGPVKGYAEGGAVSTPEGTPAPPLGQDPGKADNIDAKLSEGEFVIPADVVRMLGEDYFEKQIEKARKKRMEAAGNREIEKASIDKEKKGPPASDPLGNIGAKAEGSASSSASQLLNQPIK